MEKQVMRDIAQTFEANNIDCQVTVDAYRIGTETCSNAVRYMSLDFLCEQAENIRNKGKKVYWVTPVIPEYMWSLIARYSEHMVNDGIIDGIVVNDFGMLDLAKSLNTEIVLGRLFDKRLRDPRLDSREFLFGLPEECGVFSPEYINLIERENIGIVELETLELGLSGAVPGTIRQIAFHVPYTLVTCGMLCEFAGVSQPNETKFRIGKCHGQCRDIVASTNSSPLRNLLIKRTNAVYMQCGESAYRKALCFVDDPRFRVICTPKMW